MGQNNIVSLQHTCSEGCWGRPWEQEGCSFTQWLWYSPLLTINLSWQHAHVAQGQHQPRWEEKHLLAVKNMRRAVPHLLGNQGCDTSSSWRCLPWGAEGEDTLQPWAPAVPHWNCSVKDKSPPQLIFTLKKPQHIWIVFEKLNCKWARKACCGHLYQLLLLHVALPINHSIIAQKPRQLSISQKPA